MLTFQDCLQKGRYDKQALCRCCYGNQPTFTGELPVVVDQSTKGQQLLRNKSNTRKSVSSGYPNPRSGFKKTRRSRVFLTDFEVFGYLMKHTFKFLMWLLKPFVILGEIQS